MNDGLIPRRYAKALLKFAEERGASERCYELMKRLSVSFESNPELSTAIANPFVDGSTKTSLLDTAAGADKKDEVYHDFIKLLLENNRIDSMRHIAMAYISLYRKANNIYPVEITTASELDKQDMDRIHALIDKHVKDGKIEYSERVDPDLIGGFVITIDSERLDASLKNELKQLRLKLLSK